MNVDGFTTRRDLVDWLTTSLPASWTIVPSVRQVDPLDVVTVQVKVSAFEPAPEVAPGAAFAVEALVTVIATVEDVEDAEDELEGDSLPRLLAALHAAPWISLERAQKVAWNESRLAYDVRVTLYES